MLFPLGAGYAWWRARRARAIVATAALGIVTATALEAAQLRTPHRVTQLADVWRNALGCFNGALFAAAIRQRLAARSRGRLVSGRWDPGE